MIGGLPDAQMQIGCTLLGDHFQITVEFCFNLGLFSMSI